MKWQLALGGDLDKDDVKNSANTLPQITIAGVGSFTPEAQPTMFTGPTAANGWTWQFNWKPAVTLLAGSYQVTVTTRLTGQSFGPFTVKLK